MESPPMMPFGKYKGVAFDQIPPSYLAWFLDQYQATADKALLRDIARTLAARIILPFIQLTVPYPDTDPSGVFSEPTTPLTPPLLKFSERLTLTASLCESIITTGYRALARDAHPDHGGTLTAMQDLNAAMGILRTVVRRLAS